MKNQSRKIEIYLKDGFFVDVITASDVNTVLSAIKTHSKPSLLKFENNGNMLEGEYFEVISDLSVRLDENRTQFFHNEQILLYIKGTNLY